MKNSFIADIEFDKELSEGANNAINVCLRLKPEERITIITDNDTLEVACALVHEIKKVGSEYSLFVIEDYTSRPSPNMPQPILDDLAKSQVSIFCAQAQTGELSMRIQMTSVVNSHKIRHGHMVNINKQIMLEAMRADYLAIDDLSQKLITRARKARYIKAKSDAGTDIVAEFSHSLNWLKTSGIISVDKWGNLPGGEIFTSPKSVDGLFVVDGVVGDYLCQKYGDLKNNPLYIEIEDSRIMNMTCKNTALLDDMTAYTMTDENSNRVGEFAIGTNIGINKVIGHILQDEKLPSIHMAFGHPYSEHTGADWVSTTHIDCVGIDINIWLEDDQVMEKGKFLI
ncbi:MAG TPA: aminopeptidase [Ignavibacteria bacterium]|nr:aminopeptidase [Ignavibacteria bacterium]HQY51316.1 aminopeptidase [Ignavibacteria bacterium]HRB00540.1 aminopeptidase [Ignavibacteria bacterium]